VGYFSYQIKNTGFFCGFFFVSPQKPGGGRWVLRPQLPAQHIRSLLRFFFMPNKERRFLLWGYFVSPRARGRSSGTAPSSICTVHQVSFEVFFPDTYTEETGLLCGSFFKCHRERKSFG